MMPIIDIYGILTQSVVEVKDRQIQQVNAPAHKSLHNLLIQKPPDGTLCGKIFYLIF